MNETNEQVKDWAGTTFDPGAIKFHVAKQLPSTLPLIGAHSGTKRYNAILDALSDLAENEFLALENIPYKNAQVVLGYIRGGKHYLKDRLEKQGVLVASRYDKSTNTLYIFKQEK